MHKHWLSSPVIPRRLAELAGVLAFSYGLIIAVTGETDPIKWHADAVVMLAGAVMLWAVDAISPEDPALY